MALYGRNWYLSIYIALAVGLAMLTYRAITQLNELPISYHYIRNVEAYELRLNKRLHASSHCCTV